MLSSAHAAQLSTKRWPWGHSHRCCLESLHPGPSHHLLSWQMMTGMVGVMLGSHAWKTACVCWGIADLSFLLMSCLTRHLFVCHMMISLYMAKAMFTIQHTVQQSLFSRMHPAQAKHDKR